MRATVKVRYVNPPRTQGGRWSIKTVDNIIYGIPVELSNTFKVDGAYEVEYTEREYRGTMYKNIERIVSSAQPAAASGGGGTDDKTAERIFVCGAINASLSNANINPRELGLAEAESMVRMWRSVWAGTFGKKVSAVAEEMQDSIPF